VATAKQIFSCYWESLPLTVWSVFPLSSHK